MLYSYRRLLKDLKLPVSMDPSADSGLSVFPSCLLVGERKLAIRDSCPSSA